ncbi:DUF2306 domain-containing protein [Pontivivens insulae]|uniref:DUF2306 domain-containing protein n=1 Tax=Pontivivens insulae TaxID=1639689 RepID=A0A2R8ABD6_9RHOB|nr:DUF2306 domain-containing protein [Pontivivens insulae]RED11291.1 putative membrane protein [Pontivivens insulae]SPF29536.1 hypothetical protein POI8812_01848 [Pontivivens insulae]
MDITVITEAGPIIQLHMLTGALTLAAGAVAFHRQRRDWIHKVSGRFFVTVMLILAVSSFFIHEIRVWGPFSPIHLLSAWVLFGLWQGVSAIRRGDVAAHVGHMRGLYMGTLFGAGLFNFLPGRTTNRLFFPDRPVEGFVIAIVLMGALYLAMNSTQIRSLARRRIFPLTRRIFPLGKDATLR